MPFTPAQDAAIHARNRELLVSAAAGSGKTRVLIERIYDLLAVDGLSIDRLLVVTFTHAAAAEMRERLQARLAEAAGQDARMRRQMELLETAQISTLHSFCQKIVREYFQEVDIDPQSMLGDETVCATLRQQAKADALDGCYQLAAQGDAPAAALTRKFDEKTIDRMMDDLYPFLMGLADPFGWLRAQAQRAYTVSDLQTGLLAETLLSDCSLLADGIGEQMRACEALLDHPLLHEKYVPTIRADRIEVDALLAARAQGLLSLTAAARALTLPKLPGVRGLEGEPADVRDRYKACREAIKKLAAAIAERIPEDAQAAVARLNAMQPTLVGLCQLMEAMDARYAALKRERSLLDFHDLERMSLTILQKPAIGAEVAARFDGVFVDEYQDISGVQEAILNSIRRDVSRETSGAPQRYFYVGDVKQSIYRFRQADPSLFMGKARDFSADEDAPRRRITLNANFRSREAVLAGVNRVFQRVMRADVTEIDYDAEARLYPGAPSQADAPVSLHLFAQPIRAAERYKLQAYAIAREIRRRVGTPLRDREGNVVGALQYKDIAILGPKMKSVSQVLERVMQELGIPVYCEDRASALESEEIFQAVNHLRLLDNIADDLALLAWLRSPAGGFGDRELAGVRLRKPEGSYLGAVRAVAEGQDSLAALCRAALATLARERFLMMETPLDAYLWGWLGRSGLYAFFGCQPNGKLRQANLRMLCDKAGEHVRHRGGDLHTFLESVAAQTGVRDSNSPTILSPWEDVVRVMTIHKSKGLEFPVVFVMGLEEGFGARRGGGSALAVHPRLGIALPYVNEVARTTGDTLLKRAIDLRTQREERAERARLLYVAMTRARDELILMGCDARLSPADAATGFQADAAGTAYAVFSAGSMLDWITGCLDRSDAVEQATLDLAPMDAAAATNDWPPQSEAAPPQPIAAQPAPGETAPAESLPAGQGLPSASAAQAADPDRAVPSVQEVAAQTVFNTPAWRTAPETSLSTQSTYNPQKSAVWRVVFHIEEEEVKQALRYARGKAGLSELALRRARLDALAQETRLLAHQLGATAAMTQESGMPLPPTPTPDTVGAAPAAPESAGTDAGMAVARQMPAMAADAAGTVQTPHPLNPAMAAPRTLGTDAAFPANAGAQSASAAAPLWQTDAHAAMPWPAEGIEGAPTPATWPAVDPIAPRLVFRHHPFKVGATALVRAQAQPAAAAPGLAGGLAGAAGFAQPEVPALLEPVEGDAAAQESLEHKRLPLPLTRPRLMADLPTMPAFLRAPEQQSGVRRGVATHKALSLLKDAPLRAAAGTPALLAEVTRQVAALAARRLLTPEEASLVDCASLTRFLESPWGQGALGAQTVRREWSFNLRLPELDGLIVQGVIDLCYVQEGAWVLVDYKTDRVADLDALWALYGAQVQLYRRALAQATGLPVREAALYSLALGKGEARA